MLSFLRHTAALILVSLLASQVTASAGALPSVQLTPASKTVVAGVPLMLTAIVSSANTTGPASFYDGSALLGMAPVNAGKAQFSASFTAAGAHALSASLGSGSSMVRSAPVTETVQLATSSIKLSLASGTSLKTGLPVGLMVTVSGYGTRSGTVTLSASGAASAAVSLSYGAAAAQLTFAKPGTYTVVAQYGGNTSLAPSQSSLTVTVAQGGKPVQTGNGIDYGGGPVMGSGANLYYIWYGNWANNPAPDILTKFGHGLGGSNYYHIMTGYSDKFGNQVSDTVTLMAQVSDNYSQGKSLNDQAVAQVVASALSSGRLPQDPNGLYVVLSSSDVAETTGFCTQYCGWHSYAQSASTSFKFAFIGSPDRCSAACTSGNPSPPNGNAAADAMVSTLAHELAEAVSDPQLNAWVDQTGAKAGTEVGDLCAWNFGAATNANGKQYNLTLPTGNFYVQELWVNAAGGKCAMSAQ